MYSIVGGFFFFKQKTAYEMRISDWSSDVCSSDLLDKVALIDLLDEARPRRLTYRELDAEADAVARALVARGLKRGERVAILSINRTAFLATYLGIMRPGLVAVPVNHKFPRATIGFILADCDPKLGFADADAPQRGPAAPTRKRDGE